MLRPCPSARLIGANVDTPWSSHSTVKEVLHSVVIEGKLFRAVRVGTRGDLRFQTRDFETLLWVLDTDDQLSFRADFLHLPPYTHIHPLLEPREIFAHYELDDVVYYAVVWRNYPAPTWQVEEDLKQFPLALDNYHAELDKSQQPWGKESFRNFQMERPSSGSSPFGGSDVFKLVGINTGQIEDSRGDAHALHGQARS
ncbi:chromo (CHRromatin organization MOdifier) domain-containing protein [Cordyceps javanica]|nr:chromo (CHRromatin organization MOdifier) domain-containing protein [Cordyceps javanica]